MAFPSGFQDRIKGQLPQEADLLFSALDGPVPVSVRLNPFKPLQIPENLETTPWNSNGLYLKERPSFTLDPAFHAGMYYVQEASSMSLAFILEQLNLEKILALDLCGAPGGKSSLLANQLYPKGSFVLANEVIRARAITLKENLIKWGLPNIAVSNLDPKQIANGKLRFDLILVDAPCSGEGMFRKDEVARKEWSPDHVELCAARQKRILSDILPALNAEGYVIYSTCTFSAEENEQNLLWLAENQGLESLEIPFPAEWNIVRKEYKGCIGYAFYPHKIKGEGFFVALLQKKGANRETIDHREKAANKFRLGKKTDAPVQCWLNTESEIFEWYDGLYALPNEYIEIASPVFQQLPLQYFGLKVAEAAGRDWKPSPELAFSVIADQTAFPFIELSQVDALHFLRRDELKFPEAPQGWLRMVYKRQGLGYVKNLGKRSNNQYPKEWRILMNLPDQLESWH